MIPSARALLLAMHFFARHVRKAPPDADRTVDCTPMSTRTVIESALRPEVPFPEHYHVAHIETSHTWKGGVSFFNADLGV